MRQERQFKGSKNLTFDKYMGWHGDLFKHGSLLHKVGGG
jgi:hypothetical protein